MNVLHVNTFGTGGAAKACFRLHQGLLNAGVDSNVLLLYKDKSDVEKVYDFRDYLNPVRRLYKKVQNKLIEQRNKPKPKAPEFFSPAYSCWDITKYPLYKEADIVHLHWVSNFLDYKSFFNKCYKKMLWTLHDFNPFSGGFHYDYWVENHKYSGIIRKNLEIKTIALKGKKINIVTPSEYLMDKSKSSELFGNFPHTIIKNGIDTSIYKLRNKNYARKELGLPSNKKIILFVSHLIHYKRKGFEILEKAIDIFPDDEIMLCTVGDLQGKKQFSSNNIHHFGFIDNDETMSNIYAAADLLINPSLEDISSNTIIESLCCGTPAVAFQTGGIPELIKNGETGMLCEKTDPSSLSLTIQKALEQPFDASSIAETAAAEHSLEHLAGQYMHLYKELNKRI